MREEIRTETRKGNSLCYIHDSCRFAHHGEECCGGATELGTSQSSPDPLSVCIQNGVLFRSKVVHYRGNRVPFRPSLREVDWSIVPSQDTNPLQCEAVIPVFFFPRKKKVPSSIVSVSLVVIDCGSCSVWIAQFINPLRIEQGSCMCGPWSCL